MKNIIIRVASLLLAFLVGYIAVYIYTDIRDWNSEFDDKCHSGLTTDFNNEPSDFSLNELADRYSKQTVNSAMSNIKMIDIDRSGPYFLSPEGFPKLKKNVIGIYAHQGYFYTDHPQFGLKIRLNKDMGDDVIEAKFKFKDEKPVFLFENLVLDKSEEVRSLLLKPDYSTSAKYNIDESNYTLKAGKNNKRTFLLNEKAIDLGVRYFPVGNGEWYRVLFTETSGSVEVIHIHKLSTSDFEPEITLNWVGDIDNDGKLDVYFYDPNNDYQNFMAISGLYINNVIIKALIGFEEDTC